MPSTVVTSTQADFAGALDAVTAGHALPPDAVQSATNIDFGLERRAASCRRGSVLYGTATGSISLIVRNYGLSTGVWQDAQIPWYVAAYPSGYIYSGSGSTNSSPLTQVGAYAAGTGTGITPQWTQYNGYIYIANGTSALRTNGAQTYDWLLPQADTPTVTLVSQFGTSAAPFIGFAGTGGSTFTATEGSILSTSVSTAFGGSSPVVLCTCTSGSSTRIVLVGTCTLTNWENPTVFLTLPTGTGVTYGTSTYTLGGAIDMHQGWPGGDVTGASGPWSSTGTATQTLVTGQYGTDYQLLALFNQQNVLTIQRDYSIGDTTFTNYWHQETTPSAINDTTVDPVQAYIQANNSASITTQAAALNNNRGILPHIAGQNNTSVPPIRKSIGKTTISAAVCPWAISRSDFQFIGTIASPDFSNIQAVRTIIEFTTSGQKAVIGGVVTYGGLGFPLNDQLGGISYFQTFARVEGGMIIAEGAPSLPSTPQKCEFAHAAIVCASATNTTAGITHRVFYRTGGFLADAYRVGSCTVASGTSTIYDYALPDMQVINNPTLNRYLWSQWPSPSAGTGLPGVNAISQVWQNRVWIGVQNQLYWSIPGQLSAIQDNSQTTIADSGDTISAIIPGQNLVIVNQNSVYEMAGNVFEGTGQNWSLTRSQARRGSVAPRSAILTPYGIFLLGYDGCSLYRQGYGLDMELEWVQAKIGDMWKGTGTNDPAAVKGRVPAINPTAIFNSCAAYKDGRIYLAVPTNSSTVANVVIVLDMATQQVWLYTYPFNITSLYLDRVGNRLMAGTDSGRLMQLETGLSDGGSGIVWSFTSREWSDATDKLIENLQAEVNGTGTWGVVVNGVPVGTSGTYVNAGKGWSPISLQGYTADNVKFTHVGTQSGTQCTVYAMEWDAIPQVKKVTYFQTDPIAPPSDTYVKSWLADLIIPTGGTATGTLYVDGTVIMSATMGPPATSYDIQGRYVYEIAPPNITYGKNISAVYTCSTLTLVGTNFVSAPTSFRHYNTNFEFEAKPYGKLAWLVTYKKAGGASQADMARYYAMDLEGMENGTVTNSWIIDGTLFSTDTLIFGSNSDAGENGVRVRNYMDRVPFPPGARGYLFQQEITSTQPFKVWRASLDFDRIGLKGLSRVTQNGSPVEGS